MARIIWLCALLVGLGGALGCSDDGPQSAPEELPDDVSARVGEKGGTLKASGLTLEIPKGALDKEVRISVTNAGQSAPKELRAAQLSDVYEFGPAGTKFDKEVKVTFHVKTDDPKAAVYFTKEDGSGFEKIGSEKSGDDFVARVKHFSQGFVGVPLDDLDAGAADAAPADTGEPSDDMDAEPAPEADAESADADGMDAESDVDAPLADAGPDPLPDVQTIADAGPDADAEAGTPSTHVVVHSRDRFGVLVNQTWAAFQDGQGAWQALPTPSSAGVYDFFVTSPTFGVAFVCSSGDFVNSWNTLTYAPTSGAPLEIVTQGPPCSSTPPAVHTLAGTLVLGTDQYWRVGHAHQNSGIGFSTGPTSVIIGEMRDNEPNDVLFATGPSNSPQAINRFLVLRDRNLTANVTGANFDVVKDGVAALANPPVAQVTNANDATNVDVYYVTRGTGTGLWLNTTSASGTATRQVSFGALPESVRLPGDRYLLVGADVTQSQWRIASLATYPTGNLAVGLPPAFTPSFSAQSAPYLRPVFSFTTVSGASAYAFAVNYSPTRGSNHVFTWEVRPAWLGAGANATLTFPDFSQVPGFDTRWVAPSAASVAANAAVLTGTAGAVTVKTESGRSATVSAP